VPKKKEPAPADFDRRYGAMRHILIGNQVFHNGIPVQLLYRIRQSAAGETWCVRPLFVEEPDRNVRFRSSDQISFVHSIRAPCWAHMTESFSIGAVVGTKLWAELLCFAVSLEGIEGRRRKTYHANVVLGLRTFTTLHQTRYS